MIIRRYTPADAAAVDEIYERCHGHFQMPDIKHTIEMPVVEVDDKIVAFGAFELIPELTLVTDNHRPKREQIQVLTKMLECADIVARLNHFDRYFAFPDSNKFADILKKHYGFENSQQILKKKVE